MNALETLKNLAVPLKSEESSSMLVAVLHMRSLATFLYVTMKPCHYSSLVLAGLLLPLFPSAQSRPITAQQEPIDRTRHR